MTTWTFLVGNMCPSLDIILAVVANSRKVLQMSKGIRCVGLSVRTICLTCSKSVTVGRSVCTVLCGN